MRAKEMRERGEEELNTVLRDAKTRLFQSRLKNATHQLDNTSLLRKTRKEIARVSTVLAERRLSTETAVKAERGDEE